MEKELPVECFIDEDEVDCKQLQETEEDWVKSYSYGGSAET